MSGVFELFSEGVSGVFESHYGSLLPRPPNVPTIYVILHATVPWYFGAHPSNLIGEASQLASTPRIHMAIGRVKESVGAAPRPSLLIEQGLRRALAYPVAPITFLPIPAASTSRAAAFPRVSACSREAAERRSVATRVPIPCVGGALQEWNVPRCCTVPEEVKSSIGGC
jgi:hypothetical protein